MPLSLGFLACPTWLQCRIASVCHATCWAPGLAVASVRCNLTRRTVLGMHFWGPCYSDPRPECTQSWSSQKARRRELEPLLYFSSRSCQVRATYISINGAESNSWSRYFLPFASLEAFIDNLARDAWGLPRPRRQLPAKRHKAGDCVCVSLLLALLPILAWSTGR